MPTINGRACVINGTPVDKVYSNGRQVYGINLLTNTSDFSSNWSSWPEPYSVSKDTKYNEYPSMEFAPTSTHRLAFHSFRQIVNQSQYISSFWAKADNPGDKVHTELFGSIGATDFVLTTNWVHYSAVLTITNSPMCYFGVMSTGNKGNVYIALPKLETGSVATPWCPNPSEILTQK